VKHHVIPLCLGGVILLAWESVVRLGVVSPVVLPSPTDVFLVGVDRASTLAQATAITVLEAVLGFCIATVVAFLLAVAFVHSRSVKSALYPYAIALKATPIVALAPLIVLWAGNDLLSKVIMAALVAFFPILVNAVQGLSALDNEVVDLAKSVDASRWEVLWRLRIPGSLPYLFPGLRVGSTLAVVGAVIGEFTGATRGAGHLITVSSYYLDTPLMFAAIACTAIAGLLFFGTVSAAERYFVFWRKPSWD